MIEDKKLFDNNDIPNEVVNLYDHIKNLHNQGNMEYIGIHDSKHRLEELIPRL